MSDTIFKTISSDVIVRQAPKKNRNGKNRNGENRDIDDLAPDAEADAKAWCRLCERACQHTFLVNQISERIKQDSRLINWILKLTAQNVEIQASSMDTNTDNEQGQSHPLAEIIKESLDDLKGTPQFEAMSGRARTTATDLVEDNFKSWLANHQKLIRKIRRKRRWLAVVQSDEELAKNSNFSQAEIESQAEQVLTQIESEAESGSTGSNRSLFTILFDKLDATDDLLNRRAIIHLLKNGGKVRLKPKKPRKRKNQKKPVEPMTLEERLVAKQVEIERLEKYLLSQLPRARNLFPDQAFEEALADLVALPDPDLAKHDQYYLLAFSFLMHQSSSEQYIQFEQYLLRSMQRNWEGIDSLFYYRILSFSFLLYAASSQKYLQFGSNLLRAIKVEAERVESQFETWQESITFKLSEFLREPKSQPYPICFGYDDVRRWKTNKAGKIFFKLNGWSDLIFEVRCNRRQLPLIKAFLEDGQKYEGGDGYSGSFMLLRSIELIWKPKKIDEQNEPQSCPKCETFQDYLGKGFWNECKLSIHWTYDSEGLTRQGLERKRQCMLELLSESLRRKQEELEEKQNRLTCLEEVPEASRSKAQTIRIERLSRTIEKLQSDLAAIQSRINRLQNSPLFDRPDRPPYEGVPNIFVGVLLDLNKHLVVTVVDVMRNKVLAIRNARSVSEEGYKLHQKYLQQVREHSKQRQIDQKADRRVRQTETGLGQQVACLFARDLVKLAQEYKASTIVLPETDGWRDRLYSQLVARAKIKCKGDKKAIARYTRAHGEKLHRWDYARLSEAIDSRATAGDLKTIECRTEFVEDVYQQTKNLAIEAYNALNSTEE